MILLVIPCCIGVIAACGALAVRRGHTRNAALEATRVRWHDIEADELVDVLRRQVNGRVLHAGVAERVLSSKTGLSRRDARRMLKAA